MLPERAPIVGLVAFGLLVVVGVVVQDQMDAEAPQPVPDEPVEDTGRAVDLEHPTEQDIAFLTSVLEDGTPDGKRSAARAFVVSGDPRGVAPLFDAAVRDDDMAFCLAALEVLRLQTGEQTWRELVLALERQPPLPEACRQAVRDRHGLIDGEDRFALAGAEDAAASVRAWAAQRLTGVPSADDAYVELVADPDPSVRRAAWLALAARDTTRTHAELVEASRGETDPDVLLLRDRVLR